MGSQTSQGKLPSTPPAHGGIVQLVVHERDTVVDRATGHSGTGQPVRTDSIFYVGSIAKQFTAACVALLDHDGKLNLDAPPTGWVEDLPPWADRISIHQLVHHTAGVRERSRAGPGVPTDGVPAWGNAELLDHLRQVEDLDFEPGTRYGYSNRGYLLLAEVIAGASGSSLADMAHERIFEPLGMADTHFRDTPTPLPERAVRGHFRGADGQIHVEPARFHAVGAGGLWTTTADLARWDANLDDDRLTGGWLPERLTTKGTLGDGTPIHYAWGLSVRTHRGLPIVSHGGNFPGWETKMVRFAAERTTVIVLANAEELDVSAMALGLADLVLADRIDRDAPHADDTFSI